MVNKNLIGHTGKVKWKSPSNIALVKYWGKHGRQLPKNPSISFTLNQAHTLTEIEYIVLPEKQNKISSEFLFEGKPEEKFKAKIDSYLTSVLDLFPMLAQLGLKINSENSFPHSSGIASSASSMSALALCILDIISEVDDKPLDYLQASILARLGSGSAARSVYGPLTIWGKTKAYSNSNEEYAIAVPLEDQAPIFRKFHDDILIVSKKEKAVSSRAGHALMDENVYAQARYDQASSHLVLITKAIKEGDIEIFGDLVEKEALTLHALMMASTPPYILMEPATLEVIRKIQKFRTEQKVPVYFTLDAGPNVHMLYPGTYATNIAPLKEELKSLCSDGFILEDVIGQGPTKLS